MNISSHGECSSGVQENGDTSDAERPLKKARFAWEIKGKQHLKSEFPDEMPDSNDSINSVDSVPETEKKDRELVKNTEQHIEIIGDYLFKQDFHTLESVITDPERSLLTPCTRISTEVVSYPRYIATHELNPGVSTTSTSSGCYQSVPMSLILNFNEDRCIARWQAAQMAKAFIDNSINRIIDVWSQVQLISSAEENDPQWLTNGVADFLNNLPEDNNVENEGILMAISAHGLQNNSTSSSDTDSQSSSSSDDDTNDAASSHSNTTTLEALEDIVHKSEVPNNGDKPTELIDISYEENLSDFNNDVNRYSRLSLNLPILEYNQDENDIFSSTSEIFSDNHDFLDAAVSFAVQNKGLTSFGTEYG